MAPANIVLCDLSVTCSGSAVTVPLTLLSWARSTNEVLVRRRRFCRFFRRCLRPVSFNLACASLAGSESLAFIGLSHSTPDVSLSLLLLDLTA